jgi:molecular chaperone DnaK
VSRTTIDFGIDLGTTNSAVAALDGTEARVIKNNDDGDITPSAVYIDRKGKAHVGRRAKERSEGDPDNTATEFKRRMGMKGQPTHFAATGRSLEPEELSAEVLKALRGNVRQRLDEEIRAAVITVPAAFELNQTDATRRAAELAGLELAPLIQEPTAAALAYGFQSEADNTFWLVYDLGGGTFDAAVVHLRDGEFTVISHQGDNHLGGQQIDWAIVEKVLVPAVAREYPGLSGFGRGNRSWASAIAKLKSAAEDAKIALSTMDSFDIDVPDLFRGCDGGPSDADFEYELDRQDLEALARPLYGSSLKICRNALAEAKLTPDAVEKVLLVGGPTLAPGLRTELTGELGIELDISQDPLTVVARGAAVFAGAQRLPVDTGARQVGQFSIEFPDFEPMGSDTEPFVGGRVTGDGPLPAGLTIEFTNNDAQPAWTSGQVPVKENGTFITSLVAEKGRRNSFAITLTDATGRGLDITPDHLAYTPGIVETAPLLTHSIGLGLSDNTFMRVVPKREPLPARKRAGTLTTVVNVVKRSDEGVIRIPVLEGERTRADRNQRIGTLEVFPTELTRDVPAGSEVEVTIEVDTSRLVRATAYVPVIDDEFEATIDLGDVEAPAQAEVAAGVREAQERLVALEDRAVVAGDPQIREAMDGLEPRARLEEAERELAAAGGGEDGADKEAATAAAKRVNEAQAALDDLEALVRWPELVERAEALITDVTGLVNAAGTADDRRRLEVSVAAVRGALAAKDPDLLEQRCRDLGGLAYEILDRTGQMQVEWFHQLKGQVSEMGDPAKAAQLINEGDRALINGDVNLLRSVNRQLHQLLPIEVASETFSTVAAKGGR